MRILQTADIQVQHRNKPTKDGYNSMLQSIELTLASGYDIYIISGDLFEYHTPNEEEELMIYSHIARCVNLPNVKEIVIIDGNHDDDFSSKRQRKENNTLAVMAKLFKTLDTDKTSKLRYFDTSGVYQSNVAPIEYLVYSCMDRFVGFETITCDSINPEMIQISLYHDMIKEFVDARKLPIPTATYKTLHSVNQFLPQAFILAGDIHETFACKGEAGQKFIYPGAPIHHTFGEGYYFGGNKTDKVPVASKLVSVKIDTDSYVVSDYEYVPIPTANSYLTINLDNSHTTFESIVDTLNTYSLTQFSGSVKTFVSVNSFSKYLKFEDDIREYLVDRFTSDIELTIKYNKVNDTVIDGSNLVVNAIVDAKRQEIVKSFESDTESENMGDYLMAHIDNLVLSSDDLTNMFNTIATPEISKIKLDDSTDDLSVELTNLFTTEIETAKGTAQRKFNIELVDVSTNGFMALGPNTINLNIGGVTRITGTHGIGKTTLYNMLYWLYRGRVYPDMDVRSVNQNNLLVFNNADPDTDNVWVRHSIIINKTPVTITRSCDRTWKNGTTVEQKLSKKRNDFIASSGRNLKIEIHNADNSVVCDDVAEQLLVRWFGSTPDILMFINQQNIHSLLNMNSTALNDMVLRMIGIDYIENLVTNLPNVKERLLSGGKPKQKKTDISTQIADGKQLLERYIQQLKELDVLLVDKKASLSMRTLELKQQVDALISMGDISKSIADFDIKLTQLKNDRDAIVISEPIVVVPLTPEQLTKPEPDTTSDAELINIRALIADQTKTIDTINQAILNTATAFDVRKSTLVDSLKSKLVQQRAIVVYYPIEEIQTFIKTDFLAILDSNLETLTEELGKGKLFIFEATKQIDDLTQRIYGAACKSCNRLYENITEDMKHGWQQEIINQQASINSMTEANAKLLATLATVNGAIRKYQDLNTMIGVDSTYLYKNQTNPEYTNLFAKLHVDLSSKYNDAVTQRVAIDMEIDVIVDTINQLSATHITSIPTATFDQELVMSINAHKTLVDRLNSETGVLVEYRGIEIKIQDNIKILQSEYLVTLAEYQKVIDTYNANVLNAERHNNAILVAKTTLLGIDTSITECTTSKELLTKMLPQYESLLACKTETETSIASITTEIDTINRQMNGININKTSTESTVVEAERILEQHRQYDKNMIIWTVYESLIKNKFKSLVFSYYKSFLNMFLSDLLVDVYFSLYWDEDNQLIVSKIRDGINIYQPVRSSSGMEATFLGLSLVYTFCTINMKNSVNTLFMDELSGPLNTGENFGYAAENYQQLFVQMLSKFKNINRFIVDHHIKNLFETTTYVVCPAEHGSIGNKFIERF